MKLGRKQRWFKQRCPSCSAMLDGVTVIGREDEAPPPRPGDFSVCIFCACLLAFETDGTLRRANVLEAAEAAFDPRVATAISAVHVLNEFKRRKQ